MSSGPKPIKESKLPVQQEMFDSLYEGQEITESVKPIKNYATRFFQVLENGTKYDYIEFVYPETNIRFGLYFEGGHLKAQILEQDAVDFYICRTMGPKGHWQENGVKPYSEWIKKKTLWEQNLISVIITP